MVGIVLASHGGFADGIAQSAQMLFGEQNNFAHVILKPDEGPDDIRGKMEKQLLHSIAKMKFCSWSTYGAVLHLTKLTDLLKSMTSGQLLLV